MKGNQGKFFSITIITLLTLSSICFISSIIPPVKAKGIFDIECSRCKGTGIIAHITRKSLEADDYWVGYSVYTEITGVFYNEGPEGVTSTVYAYTRHYEDSPYYDEKQKSQYFPPETDTTVVMDLELSSAWTGYWYNMYVKPDVFECPNCKGSGYVTNWVAVGVAVGGVIGVIVVAVVGGVYYIRKRRKPPVPPAVPPTVPPPAPPPEAAMYCPQCGAMVTPEAIFCPSCGKSLK